MDNGTSSRKEEAQPLLTDANEVISDGELTNAAAQRSSDKRGVVANEIEAIPCDVGSNPVPAIPSSTDLDDDVEMIGSDNSSHHHEHSISNCDAIIHLLKGNIGTGILAMPDAIKNSGLVVGNIGLVFLSLCCVSCMHMLANCSAALCSRLDVKSLDYAQVAELSFATASPKVRRFSRAARITTNVFLCITQLGFCCVYFVFVATNLKVVFDHHLGQIDYHAYMGMILLPMLGLASVRNLRYLAPFSLIANILQMVGLCLTFFYLLQDLPLTWDRKAFATWGQLPLYFGTAIYAFEGIGVVLPIENQMRNKSDFRGLNGVLNTSMVIVTCLYIAVAFFGYLKYGEAVKGSITLNLPVDQWLSQIVIFAMCLAIFLTYGLQFYVPVKIMLPFVLNHVPDAWHLTAEYLLRCSLVLVTFALAAAIPKLDLFISLVGSVSSSTLALMAPPVLDFVTFWPCGLGKMRIARNIFLFLLGFLGFLTGSYVSLSKILDYFQNGK